MENNKRVVFFSVFALFLIFSDELFYSTVSVLGISLESGMKAREAIVIASLAYIMILFDFVNSRYSVRNLKQFFVLAVLLVLYCISSLNYPHSAIYNHYSAALLAYGALCIPATYVGMRLARGGYENAVLSYLPFFLIAVTLIVGYAIIFRSFQGQLLGGEDNDVFNYQNASYYIAYSCIYSLFYIFFCPYKNTSVREKVKYFLGVPLVLLSAAGCILGGGRGAFVYLVGVAFFLVIRILKESKQRHSIKYTLMLIIVAMLFVYLAVHFQLFNSVGARRVAENLTTDDARIGLSRKAFESFLDAPVLGHGLGSVWWEVGYYSHNMVLDFLVEMGTLGTIIMIIVIGYMLFSLIRSSRVSVFDLFILLVFLGRLFQDTFSGYWFSSFHLFLVFGYVFGRRRQRAIS